MEPPEIIIRNATTADIPAILEIYNEVILNTTAVYSEKPHTLEMRLNWFNERIAANFPVIVAIQQDTIVGFGSYGHFRIWPCYRFTAEHSVYVHQDHRGKGISKILLTQLIALAKTAGLHALIAGVDSNNEVSVKLHLKFGFTQVAHFKEVGFKFGNWLDLLFFELLL
ncbi:GNAT family N-acetyltransferase [Mucilaginibacter sp. dw_454]|uniref:GNAT family N-acetyltransferase n=1 Tax=Mucilaginibacter sp. dw_454 TaxID=2720079 RepID=UPI001BD50403|nr:GNAT family N-acetyltransferase [Mucilaginibacter sp. dw_454]